MNEVRFNWKDAATSGVINKVTQVYVWFITIDKKIVIVSKDGVNWQLPGGKPKKGEKLETAAARELLEETGIEDIDEDCLTLFGFYELDNGFRRHRPLGSQVRYYLKSNVHSKDLKISVSNEDRGQSDADQIRFAGVFSIAEAEAMIPWLKQSGEYKSLRQMVPELWRK